MQKLEAEILLEKYKSGEASEEEITKLLLWIQHFEQVGDLNLTAEDLEKVQHDLENRLPVLMTHQDFKIGWTKLVAAASVILFLFSGLYLIFQRNNKLPQQNVTKINDVNPGVNQATLTLANGKKIVLTQDLKGKIAQQGEVSINVDANSSIIYSADDNESAQHNKITYNTLSTKRGEQSPFPLTLADGTKVWLNAASSLVFPTKFSGNKREVELNGEAYFEVAHDTKRTFLVKSGNQIVQDIGTAFNISSYQDESHIKTTLVEGIAKVHANGTSRTLKPGEKTLVDQSKMLVEKADIESETAWLNGEFIFRDEKLRDVMLKLSRWYNINVVYDYDPQNVILGGGFSKNRNISKVLHAFEQTGVVKFKIDGNTITVTK